MAVSTRYRSPASVITWIASVIAAFIVLGILLVLAKANPNNPLVEIVMDLGRFFTRPFRDLFPQHDPRQNVLVNWGIAAVAYVLAGALIARIVRHD